MAKRLTSGTQSIYGSQSPYGVGTVESPQQQGQADNPFLGFLNDDVLRNLLFGGLGLMFGGPAGALGGVYLSQQDGLFGGGDQGPNPIEQQVGRIERGLAETGPTQPLGPRARQGLLASPEAFETWLGSLPRDIADAAVMSAEQNAAMNRINEQRFGDWRNLIRGAYGEAMGSFGQMRGMYA